MVRRAAAPSHIIPHCQNPYRPKESRGFQALISDEKWNSFVHRGVLNRFRRGQILIHQSLPHQAVYLIRSGRTKVVMSGPDGREALIAIRGQGELLGEFGATDAHAPMATVTALESCEAVAVSHRDFRQVIEECQLSDSLSRYVLAKTRQIGSTYWRAARLDTEQRMANLFIDIINAGLLQSAPARIPMSQRELALALGSTRSNISRLIREWKSIGLIETRQRYLLVLDRPRIALLAASHPR